MLNIVLSFILTWSIGLLPPFILRKVILRGPVKKTHSAVIAIVFVFINLLIFIALGSTSSAHFPLIIIGYISYLILSNKKPQEEGMMAKDNEVYDDKPKIITPILQALLGGLLLTAIVVVMFILMAG